MKINLLTLNTKTIQTNFKSVYPVYTYITQDGINSTKVNDAKLNKRLQGRLVRLANNSYKKETPQRTNLIKRVKQFLSIRDKDYKENPIVSSYNIPENYIKHTNEPLSYLITGKDVDIFKEKYSNPIANTEDYFEQKGAKKQYRQGGLGFIKKEAAKFKNKDGKQKSLHVLFKITHNKKGEISKAELQDMKMVAF